MENFSENIKLQIDSNAFQLLREIAKWGRFLAIAGYVGLAFLLLLGLISGVLIANSEFQAGIFVIIFYSIFVAVYIFPVYYLHRFSSNMTLALDENNSAKLTEALLFLKSHYKFLGILTLILLSLYVLGMISTVVSGVAANL